MEHEFSTASRIISAIGSSVGRNHIGNVQSLKELKTHKVSSELCVECSLSD